MIPLNPYPSTTYEHRAPEGDVYVTIARNENGEFSRIQTAVGKAGTAEYADADAIGALVGIALRAGVPPLGLVYALLGRTHEGSNSLTQTASSVADAIGKALQRDIEIFGM